MPTPPRRHAATLRCTTTTMATKQDSAWKDVIEEVGTEEERDEDTKFFIVKNGNSYAIAYYPVVGILCTVCCKLMQPGPYVSHAKACLEAGGGGKEDASSDTPKVWGHVKDLEEIQGEDNRKKTRCFRWMGAEYKNAYLVNPSLKLSGMCMVEDCCWVGHLNAMSRHMESQHKTAPNKKNVGIDGQTVAPNGGGGGKKSTEATDGGGKPMDEDTTAKKQKPSNKKKTMLGGLRVDEMKGQEVGKRKLSARKITDA
eukprot:scaffold23105_cov40-Cyclotella_meneghiniana.AAC.1